MPIRYENGRAHYHGMVLITDVPHVIPDTGTCDYYALVYRPNGTFLWVRHKSDLSPELDMYAEVDATSEVVYQATVAAILDRYEQYDRATEEKSKEPERGRRVKFRKKFRAHDFMDREIQRGSYGTCFWVGRTRRLRKGKKYIGVAVDDTDLRVYVDDDYVEGVAETPYQVREDNFRKALTEQASWELPWSQVEPALKQKLTDARIILRNWEIQREGEL